MARKQYNSIIRLFEHCGIPLEADVNLPRIKKQLTAEFGFAASGFIEIAGHSYNKNDVFEELDNAEFLQRLDYHKRIWKQHAILTMLEKNQFVENFRYEMQSFQNDNYFDRFFSPYFAIPFNYVSRNYLNNFSFRELGELLAFEGFVMSEDREEAFKPIRVFLDEQLRLLKNTGKDNYRVMRPQIKHWAETYWSGFINDLPPECYSSKHDIAFHLINLTVAIQKSNREDCRSISYELTCLTDLSPELASIIHNNHKVYTGGSVSSGSGTGGYGWVIWAVFIILKIMSGC